MSVTKTFSGAAVPQYTYTQGTVSQTGTVHLIPAPGSATRLVIDYFHTQLTGAGTVAGTVQFGTTVVEVTNLPQDSVYTFDAPSIGQEWRLPANTPFVFAPAGTATFQWAARYFTESVY